MKKSILAVVVLALTATVACAGIGINWFTQWGGYVNTAPNVTDYPSANGILDVSGGHSVIWQLIYAGADDTIDDATLATGGGNGDYVTDDDQVLATRTIANGGGVAAEDGTSWDTYLYNNGGIYLFENTGWTDAGSVYQRVFQSTPGLGTWYYTSSALTLSLAYNPMDPNTAQTFWTELGYDGGDPNFDPGDPVSGFKPLDQFPTIPEPATMGLLGLGALVLAVRRRRS